MLTVLHAGGKFGQSGSAYSATGGLHGVGLSVVNALSSQLEVKVRRNGMEYTQSYSRGLPQGAVVEGERQRARGRQPKGAPEGGFERSDTGTLVSFVPDHEIFSQGTKMEPSTVNARLKELAYLNPGVTIWFRCLSKEEEESEEAEDEVEGGGSRSSAWQKHSHRGGLLEYVEAKTKGSKTMHKPLLLSKLVDGIFVEVALQWSADQFSDTIVSYVNNVKTTDGGTHVEGLKTALTRTINTLARKYKLLKPDMQNLGGEYVRDGLTAVMQVRDPRQPWAGAPPKSAPLTPPSFPLLAPSGQDLAARVRGPDEGQARVHGGHAGGEHLRVRGADGKVRHEPRNLERGRGQVPSGSEGRGCRQEGQGDGQAKVSAQVKHSAWKASGLHLQGHSGVRALHCGGGLRRGFDQAGEGPEVSGRAAAEGKDSEH